MKRYPILSEILLAAILSFVATSCFADLVVRELGRENGEPEPYAFPYGFASEAMGFVAGVAGGISGLPQEQNSFIATALVSDEGAEAVYGFLDNYQFSNSPRLFLDASIGLGDFPQQRAYLDATTPVNATPAGSNNSSADNFFDAKGFSNWIELDFKYLLDIGSAKYNPINIFTLSNGLLVGGASGGEIFNPFKSGRSYVQTSLFHHNRDYAVDTLSTQSATGVEFSIKYDNTDFPINPSTGSIIRAGIKHDFGINDKDNWTVGELEISKFINLPGGSNVNQQVIALNAWTAHTYSDTLAPHYFGVTLGGLYRLRGYPIERFHDRSAIYYSAEYRVIPKSDFLRQFSLLDFANLQWWEIAIFYESGRVAPEWDFKELHESMKNDIGLSLRVMANHDIGRLDVVWSEEDTAAWLMYGHPF
jgi:hypothetical protein